MMDLKKGNVQSPQNGRGNGSRPGLTEGSARTVEELVAVIKRRIANEKEDIRDSESGWNHGEYRNQWGKVKRATVAEVVNAIRTLQARKAIDATTTDNQKVRHILQELDSLAIDESIKKAIADVI